MAGYDISVSRELLPGLLGGQDGLAKWVESILNQVLEAQASEALGAARHERTEERQGYRNGYRERTLYTRVGPVTLHVPQTRDGSFSTDIFKRYQRSEQALVLALMERVVQGVSTRKVSAITEELCGARFSKSTVSELCAGLDVRVRDFNERPLEGEYPFVMVDALFINSRQGDRVVKRAAWVASGIRQDGYRDILGITIGDSESYTTWDEMFRWLKGRGLSGVVFVISDDHGGITKAVDKHFQGATWQSLPSPFDAECARSQPDPTQGRSCGGGQAGFTGGRYERGQKALGGVCRTFQQECAQSRGLPGGWV